MDGLSDGERYSRIARSRHWLSLMPEPKPECPAPIVIGAGHNGLTAAFYLAKAGCGRSCSSGATWSAARR